MTYPLFSNIQVITKTVTELHISLRRMLCGTKEEILKTMKMISEICPKNY